MTKKKKSTSEVGHAKNIAHFELLIETCVGYGGDYTPTNPILSIAKLREKLELCEDAMKGVKNTKSPLMHAVNARQIAFERLKKTSTRVVNAVAGVGANVREVNDVETYHKKIQGTPSLPEIKEEDEDQETEREVSNSQQSYDKLIENFGLMISFLEGIDKYVEITDEVVNLTDLNSYLEELITVNKAVVKPFISYRDALNIRDLEMYDKVTGMLSTASTVKSYARGRFGPRSLKYKELSGISFRNMRRDQPKKKAST